MMVALTILQGTYESCGFICYRSQITARWTRYVRRLLSTLLKAFFWRSHPSSYSVDQRLGLAKSHHQFHFFSSTANTTSGYPSILVHTWCCLNKLFYYFWIFFIKKFMMHHLHSNINCINKICDSKLFYK